MTTTEIQTKRAIAYGFLALIRDSIRLVSSTVDVFIPLVKKGMVRYCKLHPGIGDENISIIGEIINEEYAIDIPPSVLWELLKRIEREVDDPELFRVHNDNSFILNSFSFSGFEEELKQAKEDASLIQRVYDDFCSIYDVQQEACPSVIDFIDNNRHILSSYISIQNEKLEGDYTFAAKFVEFCKSIPHVYKLLCNQYLGSVITCYLEFKPQSIKMDVDLLLDTNFIISLLDLNTAESTKTCCKLIEIASSLGYTFHVMKDTLEETQSLLGYKSKSFDSAVIYKFINKEDVFSACERRGLTGVDLERISDNLERKVQEWGIQIIFNTDNLNGKARFSNEYAILKSKRNTERSALHDAKAIYYVKAKRGKAVRSFEEVNCWFVNNSITHDNDSDSIDALLNENRTSGLPEIIRADDLLNILWLSNPQINTAIANSDISEIGLTSLVSFTLNKSLPKASIIRRLDENIQKYRTEDVTDRDVLMLSSRIINHQLNAEQVESLNDLAIHNREEFSRKIKEEASKEEALQKSQGERLNRVITKWEIDIRDIEKGKIEIVQTVTDENKSLLEQNAAKDKEIRELKNEKLYRINQERKNNRQSYIKEQLKKWRRGPLVLLILFSVLFLSGLAWIIVIYVSAPPADASVKLAFLNSKWFSYVFTIIWGIATGIVFKPFYERFYSQTNINSFIDHLGIPEDLRELTFEDLDKLTYSA